MHIKKLILLLFLVPVLAQAQKTTGPNYTYIAQRYEWLAGVFKALGIPAGDSAQFQTGQEMRAGAMYYDSVGVDSGLYVWSGLAWNVAGGGGGTPSLTQYRLAVGDASNLLSDAAAITGDRALISDANGVPTHSTTTATQIGYLSAATGTTGTTSTNLVFSDNPTFTTTIIAPLGTTSVSGLRFFGNNVNSGFVGNGANGATWIAGGTKYYTWNSSVGFQLHNTVPFSWSSSASSEGTADTKLFRDAAGIIAQRNATDSQEFRIYNTDNGANDEFISIGAKNVIDVYQIASEATGTGTVRDIEIASGTANTRISKLAGSGTRFVKAAANGDLSAGTITLTKNINLPTPSAAENEFIFFTPVAITVVNTRAVLVGSSTPSVTYNIGFGTDRTSLTNVYTAGQTVTSTTTGTNASGVNDATIPANSWVILTTSAQSGTVTAINASIQFTED